MAYEREREAVKAAYKSAAWRKKVDSWSDAKVIAVYFSLKQQGKAA